MGELEDHGRAAYVYCHKYILHSLEEQYYPLHEVSLGSYVQLIHIIPKCHDIGLATCNAVLKSLFYQSVVSNVWVPQQNQW